MASVFPAISLCLLFLLVAGISASVDTVLFRSHFKSTKGILVGISGQLLLFPFLGFCVVGAFQLPEVFGIPLIAVTCSPGGAYSNWWCSIFNADLALSVAMTTCSTLLSIAAMPLSTFVYVRAVYGASVWLDWSMLVMSVGVALAAITTGLIAGYALPRWRHKFNTLGNTAGVALIAFGAATSSRDDPLWDKSLCFYLAVALPCLLGLPLAFALSWCCHLGPPQRVAVAVETCYQNTGIALTLALAGFPEEQQSAAAGVPLFYGLVQLLVLPLFLFVSWRLGLTYAPATDGFCQVLAASYQPQTQGEQAAPKEAASVGARKSGEQTPEALGPESVPADAGTSVCSSRVPCAGPVLCSRSDRKKDSPVLSWAFGHCLPL